MVIQKRKKLQHTVTKTQTLTTKNVKTKRQNGHVKKTVTFGSQY